MVLRGGPSGRARFEEEGLSSLVEVEVDVALVLVLAEEVFWPVCSCDCKA